MVLDEHRAILDALDARDCERALARLDYHLEQAPAILETADRKHDRYFVE